ncbi:MAG TPA: VWA domain-containing protein [Pseudolysinimonas sp.]|nr:VWA domain-containing protein [Pseudolysinimonas sp.]
MTFEPLFDLWTIVFLLVPPAVILGIQIFRGRKDRRGWVAPVRRGVVLLLLLATAVGPAIPGALTKVVVSDIDIFLVMDTTTSSNAEDYGAEGGTRLDAMRADALRVSKAYAGARYSIISFDNGSLVRMPLVADPIALRSALASLEIEVTGRSGGSSIGEARDLLRARLEASAKAHPERLRLVFYFGDGEQTRDSPPESFSDVKSLVSAGAVFGYGTASGGPMRENDFAHYGYYGNGFDDGGEAPEQEPPPYVRDTSKPGSPRAISRIDENNLKTVARELGVGYQHRRPGSEPTFPDVSDQIGEEILVPDVEVAARLYWIPMIAAFLLLSWDLVVAGRHVSELRASRPRKAGAR